MKKTVAILICLSMLLTYLPIPAAYAADDSFPQTAEEYAQSDYAVYGAKMAAGSSHMAAVKPNGTVVAWGDDSKDQCKVPSDLKNVTAVAAGSNHTLALTADGIVAAWGDNTYNQCDINGLTDVKSIAAGANLSAAVKKDGSVIVCGYGSDKYTALADKRDVIRAAVCGKGILTIDKDKKVAGFEGAATGLPADLDGNVIDVAAGTMHWMALKKNGKVAVWGGHAEDCAGINEQIDVRAIGGGKQLAVVLLKDGTVKVYNNGEKPLNSEGESLDGITDIKAVSSAPNSGKPVNVLVMENDGTVLAYGPKDSVQVTDIPSGLNLITDTPTVSSDATLSGLAVDGYSLSPGFATETTEYTLNVPNEAASIKITATANSDKATLKINDEAVTSGTEQTVSNLNVGENTITVKVTAEDGKTEKTYMLTVNRSADTTPKIDDATLSGLTVEGYSLSPGFAAATTEYTLNVPNEAASIKITATANK